MPKHFAHKPKTAHDHFMDDLERAWDFLGTKKRDLYCMKLAKIYAGFLTAEDVERLKSFVTEPQYRKDLEAIAAGLRTENKEAEPREESDRLAA